MITKKDYLIAASAGVATAVFVFTTISFFKTSMPIPNWSFFLLIPMLWSAGVWLGGFLGKRWKFFNQFGKFAVVGFLSASIDFTVLNFMSYFTGVTTGIIVGWINIPGFLVAVVNGYLWNKLWVFGTPSSSASSGETLGVFGDSTPSVEERGVFYGGGLLHDFPKFFGVTLIGLLINSGIMILFTRTPLPLISPISPMMRLNIAKFFANAVALIWNFIGYKFIAFSNGEK